MKTIFPLLRTAFAVIIFFSIQACSGEDEIKIGLLMGDSTQERWQQDQTFFVNKVQELGGIAIVRNASNDPGNQLDQAKELLAEGVNVLVVVPVDGQAAGEIVKVAHEAGVKVLAYDRIITDAPLDYYISFNNEQVGELQAKYVMKQKPEGNYVILSGPTSDNNSTRFKDGQMNILKEAIESEAIQLVYDKHVSNWNNEEAYELMMEAFDQVEGEIDVVLAANDDLASGVRMALRQRDLLGKVLVTGQDADLDACKAILRGDQAMTVYKPIQALAHAAAIASVSLAQHDMAKGWEDEVNNGQKEVPSILLVPIPVDADNMRSYIVKDGFHAETELYAENQ
ncbi:MAG: substrate-binding domain-containing protein [Bacteroidota bacterium]